MKKLFSRIDWTKGTGDPLLGTWIALILITACLVIYIVGHSV